MARPVQPPPELARKLARLPTGTGVYRFLGRNGEVLYVGKARNLRARVRQYFAGQDERPMVPRLLARVVDVEVQLVETEKEALLLENTLIKKHRPRFNARLRDDSSYLLLRIDLSEEWPRFTLLRRRRDDGARYFGPFHSASRARRTLEAVQRAFPLRSCSDRVLARRRGRPCLLAQMGRCLAPCTGEVERERYLEVARQACLFLEGRDRELLRELERRMRAEAEALRFEEAARLRDTIEAIRATVERQRVVAPELGERDAWGLYREGELGVAAVLPLRGGSMEEAHRLAFRGAGEGDAELLARLLLEHYAERPPPPEVDLPLEPPGREALEELLGERRGGRVRLRVPARGDARRLVLLAARNAQEAFRSAEGDEARRRRALEALARLCRLPRPPRRIECYDNSHLGGEEPVAAMVVFLDGRPERRAYRRFRLRAVEPGDDYGAMREVLGRRFLRGAGSDELPELVVVDGGRGQVAAARAVLAELGFPEQPVIGLAKPRAERRRGGPRVDKVVLPWLRDPLRLDARDPALRLLQQLRDEAHREAVGYQRRRRGQQRLASVLEAVPGVGPARRRALLRAFGSAARVAEASVEELARVPGIGPALARRIHEALHPGGSSPGGS